MKLAFFNDYQLGVITEDGIVDISEALSSVSYHTPQELIRTVIEDFDNLRPTIESAVGNGTAIALDSVILMHPSRVRDNSSALRVIILNQIVRHAGISMPF